MDVSLPDLVQHQTGEIAIECGVSLSKGVDERVHLADEHNGTCDDALPTPEDVLLHVDEVLCGVGLAQIDSDPEVDCLFVIQELEDGGCHFRINMSQVDIQIREMFVADERHLLNLAVHRISLSHRL